MLYIPEMKWVLIIEICIVSIDLNNITLNNSFHEDDPYTIILTRLLPWHIKFENCKAL